MRRKVLREMATRRLLEEQITVVVVLESGKKDDAMWHVPHKVFERLVSVHIGRLMECRGVHPTTQFAYRKSLDTFYSFFVWHAPFRVHWRWGRRLE